MEQLVKMIIVLLIGVIAGIVGDELTLGRKRTKSIDRGIDNYQKFLEFYNILLQWLKIHQEGRNIVDYLYGQGFRKIAIYGMKELGIALLDELKGSPVEVAYAIDRDADNVYVATDVYKPNEDLAPVDAVIVTAVHYYPEIKKELEKKINCPIISLEDVVLGT